MKTRTILLTVTSLVASMMASNAAIYAVSNVLAGPGDTLFANQDNSLMNKSGLVTLGYFESSVISSDIDTIPELFLKLGSFTVLTSGVPGTLSAQLNLEIPGYADVTPVQASIITGANPLLNRMLYTIVTNASSLNTATLTSQFALVPAGLIQNDVPNENTYLTDTTALPIIGSAGAGFSGDANFGGGQGSYNTLKMTSIPEASTALLGALGALGLLRRRR